MSQKEHFRFERVRFHKEFGPKSLFDRVEYIMGSVDTLSLHIPHYKLRVLERKIPDEVLKSVSQFAASDWTLIACEVRSDNGKFVSSTWMRTFTEGDFVIVIGLRNSVVTIYKNNSSGIEKCVRSGPFYDFVQEVNHKLMTSESGK